MSLSLLDAAGVVTGDIWCSGAFSFESPLKDLLDSGEYTLEQLLAEDELLQELRGLHPQLIEFLSSEESVARLIQYVILPTEANPPTFFASVASYSGTDNVNDNEQEERVGNQGEKNKEDVVVTAAAEATAEAITEREGNRIVDAGLVDIETTRGEPAKAPDQWLLPGEDSVVGNIQIPSKSQQEYSDALYVRYPYMACEVICSEIQGIVDILVDGFVPTSLELQSKSSSGDEALIHNIGNQKDGVETPVQHSSNPKGRPLLDLLFSILYDSKPGEIDDYRAGYFDKILSVLFRKRPQDMSAYINGGGGKGGDVLMAAMLKHLYSHSIMQIVQRLLLPPPPPFQSKPENEQEQQAVATATEEALEGGDLITETMEEIEMDGLGLFRCEWSQSEKALKMLLGCLMGNELAPQIEQDEERKLSLYQNASEVLITIIQNSPLTSPTLHALTADPVLERLVLAATTVEEGEIFSNHDSRLTCAMNVLESLILQLGGYGSVGTVPCSDRYVGDIDTRTSEIPVDGNKVSTNTPALQPITIQSTCPEETLATSETLVLHLPKMLSSLSSLLLYEGAKQWVSPMQFSMNQPQRILGSSRLRIVRLLESLVLLGDPNVDAMLCNSDCLEVCLDLFWKFQWCSMLHQSVANLLVHVFEGQNLRSELQRYFVSRCNLLGRLMDSFWEGTEDCIPSPANISNAEISKSLLDQKDGGTPPMSSLASEKGSVDNDIFPVSDDDVDAAMEQQDDPTSNLPLEGEEERKENKERATIEVPDHTPAQSFRLGYMGHVIIICQALVHACSIDGKNEDASLLGDVVAETRNGELDPFIDNSNGEDQELHSQMHNPPVDALDRGRANENVATEETPSTTPLILVKLVDSHPLSKIWHEFISTTLATETAIQSSPLGGFQGGIPGMDHLLAHRPGLAEDGAFDDDDGAAPPLPPRGLLVGGDVIDMDDHDLDVAASMMAGMRLHQPDESADDRSRDLLSGFSSQPNGPFRCGYVFDDPLGDGRFGKFDTDEEDDSSSDEESEQSGNTGDALVANVSSAENDAPVMDLFAGNFDAFGKKESSAGAWSDFANFDDAFADVQTAEDDPALEANSNLDDVFGEVKDHAMLLEELGNTAPVSKNFDL
jgi:hypothetical protein